MRCTLIKETPGTGTKSISWPWLIFTHHIFRQVRCDNSLWGHIQTHTHAKKESNMYKSKQKSKWKILLNNCAFVASAMSQTFRSHRNAEEMILPTGCTWSLPSNKCLFIEEGESQTILHLFSSEVNIKVRSKGSFQWLLNTGGKLSIFAPTDVHVWLIHNDAQLNNTSV